MKHSTLAIVQRGGLWRRFTFQLAAAAWHWSDPMWRFCCVQDSRTATSINPLASTTTTATTMTTRRADQDDVADAQSTPVGGAHLTPLIPPLHQPRACSYQPWLPSRGGTSYENVGGQKNFGRQAPGKFLQLPPTIPVCPPPTYWGHMPFLALPVKVMHAVSLWPNIGVHETLRQISYWYDIRPRGQITSSCNQQLIISIVNSEST